MLGGGSSQPEASAASATNNSQQALNLLGAASDTLCSDGTSKVGGNATTVE